MIAPFVSRTAIPDGAVFVDLGANGDGLDPHAAYVAGHVPGAVYIDLDRWLAGPPTPESGRHPLPDPAVFAQGMSAVGVGDDDVVVAYDRLGGVYAARLVWMLRAIGHDAAVLDGGLDAFAGELEPGEVSRLAAGFTPRAIPGDRLADVDEVARAADEAVVLLDARDASRFRGEPHPLDDKYGHVPGARSLPCRANVGTDGRLLDVDTLRARLQAVGIDAPDADVISSCGSGVTACHTLLVMEHVGLGSGRLYPGSWSQWTATGRPVATGAA